MDFVVYGERVFAAIEVTSTDRVPTEDLAGLLAFARDDPMTLRVLVYRGKAAAIEHGVRVVPLEVLLRGGWAGLGGVAAPG
ncbi:MAG: hypothetical protein FJ100_19445 [Deltaproteobacteria bacterium]|nr:hypothetical protein [Deltaproteobacteria bacterium]